MGKNSPEFGRPTRIEYSDEDQKAILEAENGLLMFDEIANLVSQWNGQFHLTPKIVKNFHQIAVQGIYGCAGEFRTEFVGIQGASHVPPPWKKVEPLVDDMCDYANQSFNSGVDSIHTSAYLLWRLVWIHPFLGANGRVARALSYLAICVGYNEILPGTQIIPVLLDDEKYRGFYEEYLETADESWTEEILNVQKLESLLSELLTLQCESAN